MGWSRFDPGAGDPGGIRAMSAARSDEATELLDGVNGLVLQAGSVGSNWKGNAATEFQLRLGDIEARTGKLGGMYQRHADALLVYAAAVEQIAADAAALRARAA